MTQVLLRTDRDAPATAREGALPLGLALIEDGLIAPWQLFFARRWLRRRDSDLIDVLCARGWITPAAGRDALARHLGVRAVDLTRDPPDPDLAAWLPHDLCLRLGAVPWRLRAGRIALASCAPDRLAANRALLPKALRLAPVVVATPADIDTAIATLHRQALTEGAETRTAPRYSCRSWQRSTWRPLILLTLGLALVMAMTMAPLSLLKGLTLWAMFSLTAVSVMKLAAFIAHETAARAKPPETPAPDLPLPRISIMVPLFKEKEIAHALVRRLCRLTYPKPLLDVLLVLEEKDTTTRETLARTSLPGWMRIVTVPAGSGLTTKPRALNYALDFCRGDIIGIWDAEDAPAPDQLETVVAGFATAPPDVVCLQGVLDYYNPTTNWISRCFTIEYAAWFRLLLPGLARMGLPVPLGGTTLFLRRAALEEMGGWDAHNVTEDADLGIRISRFGYRTELIATVTHEEANHQPRAWIKQRSRWLKGYMVTWLVHMRAPLRLWREVGTWHFLGLQLIFACTLSNFLLAPLIWLFWLNLLGVSNPLGDVAPPGTATLFFLFGLSNTVIFLRAIWGRTGLLPWVFAMLAYFPLATLAAYKALYELVLNPYYWDKTAHGKTREATEAPCADAPATPARPGATG